MKNIFLILVALISLAVSASSQCTTLSPEDTMPEDTMDIDVSIASFLTASSTSTTLPEGVSTTMEVPASTKPTTTTTTLYCPNDKKVCYVDYDITGDNQLECCNRSNSEVCGLCLDSCMTMCQAKGLGVKYCFGSNISFGCDCTKGKPACYQTTTTTLVKVTTTFAGITDATKNNKPVFYAILIIITLATLIALLYYIRNI